MNQHLYTNLLCAARRLVRVAYEPADELLSDDDNYDHVAHAMALLRCQVQSLDLEQLSDELCGLREHSTHIERALERRNADFEQLQAITAQLREKLHLSQRSNGSSVRTATAWRCLRCGEYTRPSDTNSELCEACERLTLATNPQHPLVSGYAAERLESTQPHQGGNDL